MQRGFDGQGERCVRATPGHAVGAAPGLIWTPLDGGTAVRLVSRQNPVFSISGIGPKKPDGIAVRRRVQEEMVRRLEGGIYRGYDDGRREAAISIGREGTFERDTEEFTTG